MNEGPPWAAVLYMAAGPDVEAEADADAGAFAAAAEATCLPAFRLIDRREQGIELTAWRGGRPRQILGPAHANVGDPAVLAGALAEARGLLGPATRGLVIWGHGSGWVGGGIPSDQPALEPGDEVGLGPPAEALDEPERFVGVDPQLGDGLELPELAQALRHAAGDGPLAILGLDACRMGQLETLAYLADHVGLVVASADRVVAGAWPFAAFVEALAAPGVDAARAGRVLVEGYGARLRAGGLPGPGGGPAALEPPGSADPEPRSLLLVDTRTLAAAMSTLDHLGDALLEDGPWVPGRLARAMCSAGVQAYGGSAWYGHDVAVLPPVLRAAGVGERGLALAEALCGEVASARRAAWLWGGPDGRLGVSVYLGAEGPVPRAYTDVVPPGHGWLRFLGVAWGVGAQGAPPA